MNIRSAAIGTQPLKGASRGRGLVLRPPCAARPQLSLVVPAHNEEAVIAETLQGYRDLLGERGLRYEILVVMNGCTDGTPERVAALREAHRELGYALLPQAGKGRAVKLGFQLARGDWVGFVDADGQIPPSEFAKLLLVLERMPELDGVIGSKYREPALHEGEATSPLRDLAGRAFSLLVRGLLGLPYRDTQCGAKLFRRRALHDVLGDLTLESWSFDVELLLHLHRRGRRVAEVPIALRAGGRPSQLRTLRVAPQMLRDVLELRRRVSPRPEPSAWRDARAEDRRRLGEILCRLGLLEPREVERALVRQRRGPRRQRLGEILRSMGLLTPEEVQLALALQRVSPV